MSQVSTTKPTSPTAQAASFGIHIADPAPLGLAGFALTTFMLSMFNAGLLPKTAEISILGVALFYGGLAQLFAGMWEFVKGNTFGALAFSSYGAFWMALWYLFVHSGLVLNKAKGITPDDTAKGVGVFLLAWTIFTLYMTIVAARISGLLFVLFTVLLVTFAFLTVGNLAASPTIIHIGGFLGLITAFVAWYASFAGVLNATAKRFVLPTWPH